MKLHREIHGPTLIAFANLCGGLPFQADRFLFERERLLLPLSSLISIELIFDQLSKSVDVQP